MKKHIIICETCSKNVVIIDFSSLISDNYRDNILPTEELFIKDKIHKKDSKIANIKINPCSSQQDDDIVNEDFFKKFNIESIRPCSASTIMSTLQAQSIQKSTKKNTISSLIYECYIQLNMDKEKLDKKYFLVLISLQTFQNSVTELKTHMIKVEY
ncbi:uncharacterized protein VNE69_09004 [Vairimorpha necatrix]|uniref:Uncharacterized protein n=1 Tax=Vairimorpha necatrix TaxID=6039 RepID=A0AAX4JET1_9MICR